MVGKEDDKAQRVIAIVEEMRNRMFKFIVYS